MAAVPWSGRPARSWWSHSTAGRGPGLTLELAAKATVSASSSRQSHGRRPKQVPATSFISSSAWRAAPNPSALCEESQPSHQPRSGPCRSFVVRSMVSAPALSGARRRAGWTRLGEPTGEVAPQSPDGSVEPGHPVGRPEFGEDRDVLGAGERIHGELAIRRQRKR
jgi:hypothetical protein